MTRVLENLFGVRQREQRLALLMAAYHYLLLITFYLLKPVRDSLFLSERGASELPFVFILTTAVIIPVAALHTRASRRVDLGRLINGVSLLLVVCLVALRWFVYHDGVWISYVLYAWVSIYGVLITSQFWLLANAVFDAAQAKRVFPLLSLGAILGAITGGEVTGLLVDEWGVGSHNLLWWAAGGLGLSIGIVSLIRYQWRVQVRASNRTLAEEAEPPATGLGAAFEAIRGSRHLWLIVGVITLTMVTTTFVDYQFKTVAAEAYANEQALTSFMGRFYGRVSVVALVVQFLVAPYLIRMLGVGGALMFLPTGLALGALGMLFAPGLVAGVALRGTEQSLKHSIDKTGRELLFVPVDLETKKRVKVFIDLIVSKGAQGVGGLLLILFTIGLGLDVRLLSIVVLGLLGLWGGLAYRARRSYTDQFRKRLRQQEDYEPPETDGTSGEDALPAELDELLQSLCGRGEYETRRALDQLEEGDKVVPIDALRCLLDHRSPDVRAQTIRVMRKRSISGLGEAVATHLKDLDSDVQIEAARYLYCDVEGSRMERLEQGLQHPDRRIRAATVSLIAEDGGQREHELITEELLRDLIATRGKWGEEGRVQVARVLGVLDRPYRNEMLFRLLRDDSPAVVQQAIASAGQTQSREFVLSLLHRLKEEAYEKEAQEALAAYGTRILGTLYDHLVDDRVDLDIRRRIPGILALEPCQEAVEVLLLGLRNGETPVPVRHAIVTALSKLHARDEGFDFDEKTIDRAIRVDVKHYARLGEVLHLHHRTDHPSAENISHRRLVEFRREGLERIFRLLGLRYDQRDIYDAYLGITSDDPALRASAVEFVDNLVDWRTSRYLLPLLDDPNGAQAAREAPRLLHRRLRRWNEALEFLVEVDDPRLTVLAVDGADSEFLADLQGIVSADEGRNVQRESTS